MDNTLEPAYYMYLASIAHHLKSCQHGQALKRDRFFYYNAIFYHIQPSTIKVQGISDFTLKVIL